MRKIEPYVPPKPRRSWTRTDMHAAVEAVCQMQIDEKAGRDPRRLERTKALAVRLGRSLQSVRLCLSKIVHILAEAGFPVPTCIRPLPSVGSGVTAMVLDCRHALESGVAGAGRCPWTEDELDAALSVCRRMAEQEVVLSACPHASPCIRLHRHCFPHVRAVPLAEQR